MAAEYYNKIHPGDAESAGTIVDRPGRTISPEAEVVVVMKEIGIDMSKNVRTQLTEEALEKYDKIIVMAQPETVPEYLENSSKTETWDIEDAKGVSRETARIIRDKIEAHVADLVERLHPGENQE